MAHLLEKVIRTIMTRSAPGKRGRGGVTGVAAADLGGGPEPGVSRVDGRPDHARHVGQERRRVPRWGGGCVDRGRPGEHNAGAAERRQHCETGGAGPRAWEVRELAEGKSVPHAEVATELRELVRARVGE